MKKKSVIKGGQSDKIGDSISQGLILALETSGRTGSIAICDTRQMLAEIEFSGQMRHSAEVFPTIQSLLKGAYKNPQDIGEIFISIGPGSFTGLRIAVSFAKMMNLAVGSKIVAVDTLDIIAANTFDSPDIAKSYISRIAVILDAKRGQFFTAVYENTAGWQKTLLDCLMTADEFVQKYSNQTPIWLLGEGLVYYKDKFKAPSINFFDESLWTPKASQVYKLGLQKSLTGQYEDPTQLQPIYLRRALEV